MRRAIPYPWSGPSVSRVFKIMRASVPCQTSALSPMRLLWENNRDMAQPLWDVNREMLKLRVDGLQVLGCCGTKEGQAKALRDAFSKETLFPTADYDDT